MKIRRKWKQIAIVAMSLLFFSACSATPKENMLLITHSDQPKPRTFPADVTFDYIIKDGYKLPQNNLKVTFKWHQTGSYGRSYWLYQVKEKDGGYSVLNTEHEGFYVDDITEFDYSPVSVLTDKKGSFTITVQSENKYDYPLMNGVHLFEELLVKEDSTSASPSK